jgi:hypothetical protein
MKKIKESIKRWWKKYVIDECPPGYESMFDEYFERDENGNVKKREPWRN